MAVTVKAEQEQPPVPAHDPVPDDDLGVPPIEEPTPDNGPVPSDEPQAVIVLDEQEPPTALVELVEDPAAVGRWECLGDPTACSLAAPDPRTPAVFFDGPTHRKLRELGARIACPECRSEKVIYRGEKQKTAAKAA